MTAPRIALFLPSLDGGGAERMMVNLADGFAERGARVDLVLVRAEGPYLAEVPRAVRVVDLGASRVSTSLPALVRYLRRERPDVLLSTLNTANVVAVVATRLARVPTRAVVRQAVTIGPSLRGEVRGVARLMPLLIGRVYPWAHGIVAVSEGVARDLAASARVPAHRIQVAPNPIVTPELGPLCGAPLEHPWFAAGAPPVILGAGRLTVQKDFATLLRAFARVRERRPARLMILGEGPERGALVSLARELAVTDDVSLPGFVQNPFAYMARARVFVLSSAWEGLPGVLIQALACGSPVVATDCESGPREILCGGRFGRLVPVGEDAALADAVAAALDEPRGGVPPEAWAPFTQAAAVERYFGVLTGGA